MKNTENKKCLLVVFSYHHQNTEKVARAMAKILDAQIVSAQQVKPEELPAYELVGFGSGIYSDKHHPSLFDLADKLPQSSGKNAFVFSTCGVPAFGFSNDLVHKNHSELREKLQAKGYVIVDEFSCVGLNTNSFLRLWGGINKGRPNDEDLKQAEAFARNLRRSLY